MKIPATLAAGERLGLSDLVGGDPPWPGSQHQRTSYSPLEGDVRCQVAVLGGGISGALIASLLWDAGLDVLLVDKDQIGQGSTRANTALLLYEADRPLYQLAEMIGEESAVAVYALCHEAIDRMKTLAGELAEDCHFQPRPSLTIASRAADIQTLRKEYAIRAKHGFAVRLLDAAEIQSQYGFSAPGALHDEQGAQMDPYCFTHQLIKRGAAGGMRVYEKTEVIEYRGDDTGATLITDRGCRIETRHTIFATGYEAERYISQQLGGDNSTFAILSEPIPGFQGWGDGATIWETARPYIYLRTTADGRILIGGLDEPTVDAAHRNAMLKEKSQQLLQRLRRMFPDLNPRIGQAWGGTFLNTPDSLPYIGQRPEFPGAWFALSYGGNGTTFAMVAAALLRDQLMGRAANALELFRFDRPSAKPTT